MKKLITYVYKAFRIESYFMIFISLIVVGLSGYLYFYNRTEEMKIITLGSIILLGITILRSDVFKTDDKNINLELQLYRNLDLDYLISCINNYEDDCDEDMLYYKNHNILYNLKDIKDLKEMKNTWKN